MYNSLLATLIAVADCGSFTKAAERLYISPTAVMKQINALEKHLDLKLLDRTATGVRLTAAGAVIDQDARFLIDYSNKSVASAKMAARAEQTTFRVGTSLLNPAKPFMDLWYRVNRYFPDYKLHLVPFEDDHDGIITELSRLGEKFDFLIGVCDSRTWLSHCNLLPLGRYRKMIAVSREHRLAQKPQIRLEDTPPFYDMSVFNRCAETGNVLLTLECWTEVHPALVSIPVDWDYTISYGLLYSLNPTGDVRRFVETVETTVL